MAPNELENYLALLTIRRAAWRRDIVILGGIFIVSFLSIIALGLLDRLSGRSLYLVVATVVAIGFGCLTTWVKLEITKGLVELLPYLQRTLGGSPK
ncbi:MAG TPA: hypothetical protein VGA72_08190 [Anaerolineales bacterium]